MAYDVDFWYISQDACQISTDFTPFIEAEEESIYMKTSDFFEMIERFTDPDLERKAKAWENYVDSVRSLVSKHADEDTDIEKEVRDILSVYMEDE